MRPPPLRSGASTACRRPEKTPLPSAASARCASQPHPDSGDRTPAKSVSTSRPPRTACAFHVCPSGPIITHARGPIKGCKSERVKPERPRRVRIFHADQNRARHRWPKPPANRSRQAAMNPTERCPLLGRQRRRFHPPTSATSRVSSRFSAFASARYPNRRMNSP